ncbi:leucine-rich repeat-containing protein 38 isoform X2 [Chaetodon auriga]|uniref:leucine-rich repeat-containing protein 38 isoform X2 n=1 Tax=Chaetodon auriga TaxID=39042 RepID=UPI004032A364
MLPCIDWLQPFLTLISSTLLTQGHNCPSTCLCPDHHTVDCTSQGLTRVPDFIPLDVRRLLLSNNWIPWIPSDFLALYSDLVYLDLRNNSLSQLEPGTLSTFSRLVFLDLGSNNLTDIPSGTFGESRSLIKLRLGNNTNLNIIGRDAFTGLTSLRELELEKNGLTELDISIVESLPSLRMLRLEGNPWLWNCHFAKLFAWLMENRHKLPKGPSSAPVADDSGGGGDIEQGHAVKPATYIHRVQSSFRSSATFILLDWVHPIG